MECTTHSQAAQALEKGKYLVMEDPMIMMDLDLDIIAESTGIPEAGAKYVEACVKHGKHIAMINKETDSVLGPYLKKMANDAGLLYTPVEGDQHGLLMSMVSWAKSLGLEIINAGKMRDAEYVYTPDQRHVICLRDGDPEGEQIVSAEQIKFLDDLPEGEIAEYLRVRKEILPNLPHTRNFDICECVVAANALGMAPDIPELHLPIVRTREIPRALCSQEDGGILSRRGVLDSITQLRTPQEANLGGGVYIVVSSDNEYSRYILNSKGLMHNTSGSASLIYRPYHLCGVETSTSLLCAAMLGFETGYEEYHQTYDMVRVTTRDMKQGEIIGDDYSFDYYSKIVPATKMRGEQPIPAHMAFGNRLKTDVPEGSVLTYDMIERPENSALWRLREDSEK